jgi:hypothetical protein
MKRLNVLSISTRLYAPESTVMPFKGAQPKQMTTARRPMRARGNPVGRVQGTLAAKIDDSGEKF